MIEDKNKIIYSYKALNGIAPISTIPVVYRPRSYPIFPTEIDYENGSYDRYFFKRLNEQPVYETVEIELQKLDGSLYKTATVTWYISDIPLSEITRKNEENIRRYVNSFPELSDFLSNKSQFYRGR